jgi:cell division protein FtsQ
MAIRVDPRLRARRVAVRRAEGRRRLRFVILAAGLVGLVAGAWGITRSPLLDLDRVRIDPVSRSEVSGSTMSAARLTAVEAAVGLELGTPMFDLDLGEVEAAVESLPWVASAEVERDWPGTVRVAFERRTAIAVLGPLDGVRFLIDGEGVLIGTAPLDTDLPVISIEPSAALGEIEPDAIAALAVASAIPDDLLPWVDAITVAAEFGAGGRPIVGLDLVGSARVEMGTVDLIDDKLAAVRAILESTSLACINVIDVVVADLTTVTRDPVCDAQASVAASDEHS